MRWRVEPFRVDHGRRGRAWCGRSGACGLLMLLAELLVVTPRLGAAPLVEQYIGIEGQFVIRVTGPKAATLMARPTAERPAVVARIAAQREDAGAWLYDIRFIARRPGSFDVREALQFIDGSTAAEIEAMPIKIKGVLPAEHDLHTVEPAASRLQITSWYFIVLVAAGVLWVLVPVVAIIKRMSAPQVRPVVEAVVARSLFDRLRPLLELAARGELSLEDRSKLELIALGGWIERLGVTDLRRGEAIAKLREHAQARAAVELLEAWLHKPGSDIESFRSNMHVLIPPGDDSTGTSEDRSQASEMSKSGGPA